MLTSYRPCPSSGFRFVSTYKMGDVQGRTLHLSEDNSRDCRKYAVKNGVENDGCDGTSDVSKMVA